MIIWELFFIFYLKVLLFGDLKLISNILNEEHHFIIATGKQRRMLGINTAQVLYKYANQHN